MHDGTAAEAPADWGLGGERALGSGQERGRIAKDAILTAAMDCLLEDGYAATTTLRVQQRAGVSRGKLLHHFPSKRVLIASAVKRLMDDRMDAAQQSDFSDAPAADDVAARVEWAVERMWETFFADNFWAAMETWIAARTDPELAGDIVDHERRVLRRVRASSARSFGEVVAADPDFRRSLDLVFTSMRGMALTYTFSGRDPRTEPMLATWVRAFLT
ncbi:TetR/AcrR family transcriptional regulator [Brevibacterium jeotgali]|uniref:Transcriptional regulator, TetR family n=1 Tax=Brevibacterium jeotgali TaxID=1262550 RepID=A0A2H1L3Z1_9MICO|nr:TetR/AcrR family transcriptional regulator [Brevibacterium jeotgali]TWB98783.1 TetR family transcriptional regulator [Brevibacterium jeotgali]SMY11617.1 transcriptional regulator, TetR family [Brevibacterium jeotgali]